VKSSSLWLLNPVEPKANQTGYSYFCAFNFPVFTDKIGELWLLNPIDSNHQSNRVQQVCFSEIAPFSLKSHELPVAKPDQLLLANNLAAATSFPRIYSLSS